MKLFSFKDMFPNFSKFVLFSAILTWAWLLSLRIPFLTFPKAFALAVFPKTVGCLPFPKSFFLGFCQSFTFGILFQRCLFLFFIAFLGAMENVFFHCPTNLSKPKLLKQNKHTCVLNSISYIHFLPYIYKYTNVIPYIHIKHYIFQQKLQKKSQEQISFHSDKILFFEKSRKIKLDQIWWNLMKNRFSSNFAKFYHFLIFQKKHTQWPNLGGSNSHEKISFFCFIYWYLIVWSLIFINFNLTTYFATIFLDCRYV